MNPGAAAIYQEAARSGARPDPNLKVSEWADEYRILTERSSPEPGRWRTSRVPYLKDIMDDLSPASPVERVVFMKGAQTGGTECGNNWLGFVIHLAPGPMMLVQPTTDMVIRNSKQRIGPLIQDCPVLRERIKTRRDTGSSGNTVLVKEFPGGMLVMTGANSGAGLRSMSARYLFLDEVDGYPGDVDHEGDPCGLAMVRTSNFARSKTYIVSTPVTSGRSNIEHYYEESDQREHWVPCPHCSHMQVFEFAQLRWPKGQPLKAQYFCLGCSKPIENHHKTWMLANGQWRPHAPGDGRFHGYHISSLSSPVGWLSWPQIAEQRESAGKDLQKLKIFQNTVLGLPFAETGEVPDYERLYERRESYPIGRVPAGALILTAGVDVQMNRIEVEIVGWGRDKQSWSIDYRVYEGPTTQPEVWSKLAPLIDEDFPSESGASMRIRRMAVDSGFNTMTVYDFIRRMKSPRVIAVKGERHIAGLLGPSSPVEVGPQGRRVAYGIRLWPINSDIAKEELYRWLRSPAPDLAAGEAWPVGYCHFPSYSKEYFEELCSEALITRMVSGRPVTRWEKLRERNEALDCRVYARAAAVSMRVDNWAKNKWDDMEDMAAHPDEPHAAPPVAGVMSTSRTPMPEFKPIRSENEWLD